MLMLHSPGEEATVIFLLMAILYLIVFAPTRKPRTQTNFSVESKDMPISNYRDRVIAPLPDQKVFQEKDISFADIYVRLNVRSVVNGQIVGGPQIIDPWVQGMLRQDAQQNNVMFIQGPAGRGKSIFCRMFAASLLNDPDLGAVWTPVLIRLRYIDQLMGNFLDTLRNGVQKEVAIANADGADFTTDDDSWFTGNNQNTRFLFLLDGFDELAMQGRPSDRINQLIQDVAQYQGDPQINPIGHRFLITGRPLVLLNAANLPANLTRVEIQNMDNALRSQWLQQWSIKVGQEKAAGFGYFLTHCPQRVNELAREPLLLYVLALMHRNYNLLDPGSGEELAGVKAEIKIYEEYLDWVLTKQRPGDLNPTLTKLKVGELKLVLEEAALCAVQSGGGCASLAMLDNRLQQNPVYNNITAAQTQLFGDNPLIGGLATFYIQPAVPQQGSVEFLHSNFRDFLCAKKLKTCLEKWTQQPEGQNLDQDIYDLLGYGGLTQETVDYLMELLDNSQEFNKADVWGKWPAVKLFKHLRSFYESWVREKTDEQIPARKLAEQKQQQLQPGIQRKAEQVDVFAELNVMILLLELHRYAERKDNLRGKIVFYPCGQNGIPGFDSVQLRRLIAYSNFNLGNLQEYTFAKIVGPFLSETRLNEANLSGLDLSGANLSKANLIDADLSNATLTGATLTDAYLNSVNLSYATLTGANLSNTNLNGAILKSAVLTNADLSCAYLGGANLRDADLTGAKLQDAMLCSVDFTGANLNNIQWNDATNRLGCRGL